MVCLIFSDECQAGKHDDCDGGKSAPPGHFGGSKCTCRCHGEKAQRQGEKKITELLSDGYRVWEDGGALEVALNEFNLTVDFEEILGDNYFKITKKEQSNEEESGT